MKDTLTTATLYGIPLSLNSTPPQSAHGSLCRRSKARIPSYKTIACPSPSIVDQDMLICSNLLKRDAYPSCLSDPKFQAHTQQKRTKPQRGFRNWVKSHFSSKRHDKSNKFSSTRIDKTSSSYDIATYGSQLSCYESFRNLAIDESFRELENGLDYSALKKASSFPSFTNSSNTNEDQSPVSLPKKLAHEELNQLTSPLLSQFTEDDNSVLLDSIKQQMNKPIASITSSADAEIDDKPAPSPGPQEEQNSSKLITNSKDSVHQATTPLAEVTPFTDLEQQKALIKQGFQTQLFDSEESQDEDYCHEVNENEKEHTTDGGDCVSEIYMNTKIFNELKKDNEIHRALYYDDPGLDVENATQLQFGSLQQAQDDLCDSPVFNKVKMHVAGGGGNGCGNRMVSTTTTDMSIVTSPTEDVISFP
ncbi:unnamed protein product [Ambrosiozyma monospora]|uniref:Unnamed protein product n=1 Tax=Ambrosiozyma monospora TaxID=43982 RepID=A0A9W6Z8B8_AMBMO|nr:unnamed protein product [Ambrosiozyma monospora]